MVQDSGSSSSDSPPSSSGQPLSAEAAGATNAADTATSNCGATESLRNCGETKQETAWLEQDVESDSGDTVNDWVYSLIKDQHEPGYNNRDLAREFVKMLVELSEKEMYEWLS